MVPNILRCFLILFGTAGGVPTVFSSFFWGVGGGVGGNDACRHFLFLKMVLFVFLKMVSFLLIAFLSFF